MGGQDRLRAAHVRVRRHQRIARGLGLVGEHGRERGNPLLDLRDAALQVEPEIDRDLLVARPAGVQPAPGVADPRHQLALDERVHVLVVARGLGREEGRIRRRPRGDVLERGADDRRVGARQHAGALQAFGPRQASPHVVLEQAAIEPERRAELEQRRIGIAGEPAGPEVRHRSGPHRFRPGGRLARRGLDRQPPDLDEPFRRAVIEEVPGVVGREAVIVERERRLASDDAAVAFEELEPDDAGDLRLDRPSRTRRSPRASCENQRPL